MQIRIFRLTGHNEVTRRIRLERLRSWMEPRGWEVMDIAEEAESVAFERAEGAPPLGWFDRTRWLPGPGWFSPSGWIGDFFGSPRQALIGLALLLLVAAGFLLVLRYSHQPDGAPTAENTPRQASRDERWWWVNADLLNVRDVPDGASQIVGVLYHNQRVLVEEIRGEWVRVSKPERGFISRQFLSDHPLQNR